MDDIKSNLQLVGRRLLSITRSGSRGRQGKRSWKEEEKTIRGRGKGKGSIHISPDG